MTLLLLPDGSILPPHTARSWQRTLEELENESGFPQSLMEFHQLVTTKIGGLLSQHGFQLSEDNTNDDDGIILEYMRENASIHHGLSVYCDGGDGEFNIEIYLNVAEYNMTEICRKSDFQYSARGGVLLEIPKMLLENKNSFYIVDWDGFNSLLFTLGQSPLRWSDAAQDIKGVDALLNGDVDEVVKNEVHTTIYMPYCLICARLAGNPNFEDLAVSLGTYGKGSGKFWGKFDHTIISAGWPKLVKYLREEVKPLV